MDLIPLLEAENEAQEAKKLLEPHCIRIQIAGSIRRKKKLIKDIEIVAIPKPYNIGLFQSGIATVLDKWKVKKGHLPCKYTQRILPSGIKLDLFFADKINWGYILAIRTGSSTFSNNLAKRWLKMGYKGQDGYLTRNGIVVNTPEEKDIFDLCNIPFVEPHLRTHLKK